MKFPDDQKVKHTPGPWYPSRCGGGVCATVRPFRPLHGHEEDRTVRYYGGHLVCESMGTKADVALTCMAPDMYRLLVELHDWFDECAVGSQALAFQERINDLLHDTRHLVERS